jgi:SPP1 gp7 family putative phage head morphogenesis protein
MARRELLSFMGARRRNYRRLQKQRQPDAIRMSYFRAITELLDVAKKMVDEAILPLLPSLVDEAKRIRGDGLRVDAPKDVNDRLEDVSREFYKSASNEKLAGLARRYARRTSDFQKEQLQKQIKQAISIEVPITDRNLSPRIEAFTAENVALLVSVPDKYFDDVGKTVLRAVNEGLNVREVAAEIKKRFEVSESSAQLIARDQISKFQAGLNAARQKELGVDKFTWETSGDFRVRDEHAALSGKTFSWNKGDSQEGFPGDAVNCRCSASPVLDELLEDL